MDFAQEIVKQYHLLSLQDPGTKIAWACSKDGVSDSLRFVEELLEAIGIHYAVRRFPNDRSFAEVTTENGSSIRIGHDSKIFRGAEYHGVIIDDIEEMGNWQDIRKTPR